MRLAAVLPVLAACASAPAAPPAVVANTAVARPEPWTLPRVLATVPATFDAVITWNADHVRRAPLVADHWGAIMEVVYRVGGGDGLTQACPHLIEDHGGSYVIGLELRGSADMRARVWALGIGREYLDCTAKGAALTPDKVRVVSRGADRLVVEELEHGVVSSYLLVDADTVVVLVAPGGVSPADVDAAVLPAEVPFDAPELAWLAASNPPIWAVFVPNSPQLQAARATVRSAGLAIRIGDRLELDGRAHVDPAQGSILAGMIEQQLDTAVRAGFADEAEVVPADDRLELRVVLERATVEKLVKLVMPMLQRQPTPPMLIPGP